MASQDWLEKDFYQALGVAKDADAKTIKKAYRSLARTYHPDKNPGDAKAEARFKEISEAYQVLSDAKQRKEYDALRAMAAGGPRFAAGGVAGGFEDLFSMFGQGARNGAHFNFADSGFASGGNPLSDIFSAFGGQSMGGFSSASRRAGEDISATVQVDFWQAVRGDQITLEVDGKKINVKIPVGVADGKKLRLRGKGRPGLGGGPAGDLILTVQVSPHPIFTLSGKNVRLDLPISFTEASLGATVEVPTLEGKTVKLKVAPGTSTGTVLRARGKGLPLDAKNTNVRGDLLAKVEVTVPKELSMEQTELLQALAKLTDMSDMRREWLEKAKR